MSASKCCSPGTAWTFELPSPSGRTAPSCFSQSLIVLWGNQAGRKAGLGCKVEAQRGGTEGRLHYNVKKKKDKQQQELQDLLIDPAYDPLFDDIDNGSSFSSRQDPFQKPAKQRPKRKSPGRPIGSARTSIRNNDERPEDYMRKRQLQRKEGGEEQGEDLGDFLKDEEEDPISVFDVHLKYMRHYFLQEQQEHVMELHHKHRATEVSQYAQATALAHLMERLERDDETSEDMDPLPSWIRAKKMIAENWDLMEQFAGNRQETIKNLQQYSAMTPERQHLIDTWDESLYEGDMDPEKPAPDYMDQFLMLSEAVADQQEEQKFMLDILPDLD